MKKIIANFGLNGAAVLLIILALSTAITPLHAQSITSSQAIVSNGTTITLNGSGFAANENVSLQVAHLNNTPYSTGGGWVVTTDQNGAFHTTVTVPSNTGENITDLKVTAHARTSALWVQYFLDGVTPAVIGSHKSIIANQPITNNPPAPIPSEFLIDCSGVPDPGNTQATSNPVCANLPFTLSLQNSGGSGVTYQWQSDIGAGFADIAGATNETLTTSQAVGTNYQCIITCTGSGLFTASSNLLVSMSNAEGCQLTVTAGGTATEIAQKLLGPGVTISNATINCTSNAYGVFSGGLANLGLTSGIVLTSGSAVDLIGPNSSPAQTTDNLMPGDPELDALTTSPTFDACYISFDFVATCDSIVFDYVFGSEEYPEYVNSPFNDVFAFFISGPGINGTQNMALVPGALIPIEINNVNDGYTADCPATLPGPCMNCAYYVNNCEGTTLQYDGHTVALAATSAVTPGSTYHLKIAIADAGDPVLDSGVMLESKSLSCVSTAVIEQDAYRGCQNGEVRFCREGSTADAVTIHFTIGGTAVSGVDYVAIADSITIPAGQQCKTLEIVPTLAVTNEVRTVVLTTTDGLVLTVNITDGVTVTTSVVVDSECGFSTITASGADTYKWKPDDGLTNDEGETVIASPSDTTTYMVIGRITESGCVDTTYVTINPGPALYIYYRDADGDSYGNVYQIKYTCLLDPPAGYVINSSDCNDGNASVNPGATEVCGNNIDDNCNGQIDENCGGVCPVATGLQSETSSGTMAKVEWNEVNDAEGYKIRYRITGSNTWKKVTSTNDFKKLSNLTPSSNYTWQIKTYCTIAPNVMSDWSSEQFFTTGPLKSALSVGETIFEVHPNPLTSSAIISFSIAEDSKVLIELYDLTGRNLQTLFNANVGAGSHEVTLNRDQLSNGIYFVKLSVNNDVQVKKVVID